MEHFDLFFLWDISSVIYLFFLLLIYNESWQELYFRKVENENIGLK